MKKLSYKLMYHIIAKKTEVNPMGWIQTSVFY